MTRSSSSFPATGAAIACGRGGLALRAGVALAVAYAAAPATTDAADVTKMKVSELRAALEAAGADSKGLKAELVERLAGTQRPRFTRLLAALLAGLAAFAAGPRVARYLLPVAELERDHRDSSQKLRDALAAEVRRREAAEALVADHAGDVELRDARESELIAARDEIDRLEGELAARLGGLCFTLVRGEESPAPSALG